MIVRDDSDTIIAKGELSEGTATELVEGSVLTSARVECTFTFALTVPDGEEF